MTTQSNRRTLAFLLVLAGAVSASGADRTPRPETPWTIMPDQTATFVADEESAQLISGLAEFSTQLLLWTDTPRSPVIAAGATIKSAFVPFIDEWRDRRPKAPRITAAAVIDRVSAAYLALESPRFIRITVGPEISVSPITPADVLGAGAARIPFIVSNTRPTAVRLVLGRAGSGSEPLHVQELKPRQALGFFLDLRPESDARSQRLAVRAEDAAKEFEVPFLRREAATLRVSVVDETGAPTPARVYLTGTDRRAYSPEDAVQRIVSGEVSQPFPGDCYFHTAGSFSVELPVGRATLEVVKGMEHIPVRVEVPVVPGDRTTMKIQLRRLTDMTREGWYSGDVHVHGNMFAKTAVTPRDALLVAKAEDLNVLNLLPCNDPRTTTISDLAHFTGAPDPVSERNYILYYNEEMRNDIYGHVGFLNLKSFVEPAYFGWAHSPLPYDAPGNFPQVARAKAQGGVSTYVHPGLPSEFPVDIALGIADTIDVMSQRDERITTGYWYRLLNCGFRCPASAGTDSMIGIPCHLVTGAGRVYVHAGPELTYPAWIEAYKHGRTFVTNGPLLRFTVDGHESGDEIRAQKGPVTLAIEGSAVSIIPINSVEIIVNGRQVRTLRPSPDHLSVRFSEKLEIKESSWVAIRALGPGHRLAPNDRDVYAHSSPVYVTIGGRPIASKSDAQFLSHEVDALIAKMDKQGVFSRPAQRDEVVRHFRSAQEVYRKIAAQAPR